MSLVRESKQEVKAINSRIKSKFIADDPCKRKQAGRKSYKIKE
jgi:hypothetical protein